jgi:hypothetical protein
MDDEFTQWTFRDHLLMNCQGELMLSRGGIWRNSGIVAAKDQFLDCVAFKPSRLIGLVRLWDCVDSGLRNLNYLNLPQREFIKHHILTDIRARENPHGSLDIIERRLDEFQVMNLPAKTVQQCLFDLRFQEQMTSEVEDISSGINEILRAACDRRTPEAITFVSTPENHFGTGFPISQKELTQIVSEVYSTLSSVTAYPDRPLHFHLSNIYLHITTFESLLERSPYATNPETPEVLNCTIVGLSGKNHSVKVYIKQMIDPTDLFVGNNKQDQYPTPEMVDPHRVVLTDGTAFTCDTCLEFRGGLGYFALAQQLVQRENVSAILGYHSVTANTLGPVAGLESELLRNSAFPHVFINDFGQGPSLSLIEEDKVRQLPIIDESPAVQNPKSRYANGTFISFPRIELLPLRAHVVDAIKLLREEDNATKSYKESVQHLGKKAQVEVLDEGPEDGQTEGKQKKPPSAGVSEF